IDRRQFGNGECRRSQTLRANRGKRERNSDPAEENRIGQDRDSKKVQENSGMTKPGRRQAIVRPFVRPGLCWGRRDRSPGFHRPLVPEVCEPAASDGEQRLGTRHAAGRWSGKWKEADGYLTTPTSA